MKKGTLFTLVFRIMGIVVLILGIRLMGAGVWNYIEEHNQKDWTLINAEVIDISSKYSGIRSHVKSVKYDITYQYEVNGEKYSDTLYNRSRAMGLGDKIKIKYDPESPEHSTDILSPSLHNLIVFLVFGILLTTAGYFLSGVWALIRKIRRRGQPEEEEFLPPEEYVEAENIHQEPKNKWILILRRIIPIAAFFGILFLSLRLFPAGRAAGIKQFQETAREMGYTASDTTDELRQSFRVGSMMKEAISINDGNVRIDFCIMDTADSANILYEGMTLPVANGEKKEHKGNIYELYSMENDGLYTAKIRRRDTVIYVSAKAEYKSKATEFLMELGYWEE